MNHSTPGLPVHHQLLEFTQTRIHRVSDAIQPSHPLSSPSPPAPNPSQHQSLFQRVNSSHEVAKVLEFHFSIIPSKEIPELIFRMDWLDILVVQGTLKSLLQHYSSKVSILRHLAFFTVQLSNPYMFSSVAQSCPTLATPWIAARLASLSITNSRSSLRLTSIESVMPSSHLILCHPLLLLCPIPPSMRVFSNESILRMRWPKYWSFSFRSNLSILKEISPGI